MSLRTGVATIVALAFAICPPSAKAGQAGNGDPAAETAARGWFGSHFEPLSESPPNIISDSDEGRELVREWLGLCHDEPWKTDEFALKDCRDRVSSIRAKGAAPRYLRLSVAAVSFKYDFSRAAFVAVFSDDFVLGHACDEPTVSVWRPQIPDRSAVACSGSGFARRCELALPRTFHELRFVIPMREADARAWKERLGAQASAYLTVLVSLRPGENWRKNFASYDDYGKAETSCHQGALAQIHGVQIEVTSGVSWREGTAREWAYPAWMALNAGAPSEVAPSINLEAPPGGADSDGLR